MLASFRIDVEGAGPGLAIEKTIKCNSKDAHITESSSGQPKASKSKAEAKVAPKPEPPNSTAKTAK
jgi:hypothetical protein